MKKRNLKNHLRDLNSDMGLILRDKSIKKTDTPHYFEVRNLDGKRYVQCGNEQDAKDLCEMHSGFTYEKIYLPHTPKTVNVPHVRLDDDLQLPEQKILNESELEPFIV